MSLGKGVLKICSEFTGEHPCRSTISIKSQSIFIEITLRHVCSPVNLIRIFRNLFLRKPLDGCFRFFISQFSFRSNYGLFLLEYIIPDYRRKLIWLLKKVFYLFFKFTYKKFLNIFWENARRLTLYRMI